MRVHFLQDEFQLNRLLKRHRLNASSIAKHLDVIDFSVEFTIYTNWSWNWNSMCRWWEDVAHRIAVMKGCHSHKSGKGRVYFVGHFSLAFAACMSYRLLLRSAEYARSKAKENHSDADAYGKAFTKKVHKVAFREFSEALDLVPRFSYPSKVFSVQMILATCSILD